MSDFKSRFIYIVFIARLSLLLLLLSCLIMFVVVGVPSFFKKNEVFLAILISVAGIAFQLFVLYSFGKATLTQRYKLIEINNEVFIQDFFSKKTISSSEIKGFSISNYGNRSIYRYIKTIIIYCHSGQKIELPQFLYWNFEEIRHFLLESELITYLGEEGFQWKNLFNRTYTFD